MASRTPKTSTQRPGRDRERSVPLEFIVVGIGASSGGLASVSKLLDALPPDVGMAFVLVQHLDPTHESLLADLLALHTRMTVVEAVEGMPIAINHLYIIAPGTYLTVSAGSLHLSPPAEKHGARLPFDFTLKTLADAYGPNAVCVVLSGNGADGSEGLAAVAERGGLIIAQSPDEAAYPAMPANAIATGRVDLVLAVADMGEALVKYQIQMAETDTAQYALPPAEPLACLPEIIELLRQKTKHDYSLYKPGTLQRRIERRMTLASLPVDNMSGYLDMLRQNDTEVAQLAKDLLIHVTGFFRDPTTFDLLANKLIPDMVRNHPQGQPLRVWSVGCSTGEEAYSLAILFSEALGKAGRDNKLQIFASDADADSIAIAREGYFSAAIENSVSPERLKEFFTKEESGYRIAQHIRASVVFTVQDLLVDPPFSRLDLVSCRNVLIYLGAEAQARAIALFHFALRSGGLLLLGASETPGTVSGRFDIVSKPHRVFRQVGRTRPGDFGVSLSAWDGIRPLDQTVPASLAGAVPSLADLCRQWTLDSYAPAAVLLNDKNECLYRLGAVAKYLTVSQGHPTLDILDMAAEGLRPALRSALQHALRKQKQATQDGDKPSPIRTTARFTNESGQTINATIEVRSLARGGSVFLLAAFSDSALPEIREDLPSPGERPDRHNEVDLELEATRTELESVLRNFERSYEEQKAINEEASSVNEELQSANEELLTSKEELQSLNEELTALNGQLQETLDRQRTTASDLQNVLYSTNVATLFLDTNLNIRFFTPTTRSLFKIIPGDIGRPLSDLHSLARDTELEQDAAKVLRDQVPVDREIETRDGFWFLRRVMPYLTEYNGVDGVVITFTDVTERNRIAADLLAAKQQADLANIAKTRFLAAASHDLRQPLQSLVLLQGLLVKAVRQDDAVELLNRVDETIESMSRMLNMLLDINQFESGMFRVQKAKVSVNDVFNRLKNEFQLHAQARHLSLRVVATKRLAFTDSALLEQLLRNLLSNAIKYTRRGGVLMGCRRRGTGICVEIWDTGIGISDRNQKLVFDEYFQVDNAARQRSRGLGLGLSIVKRLAEVLDHDVSVQSRPGQGSVFSILIDGMDDRDEPVQSHPADKTPDQVPDTSPGSILVIEDDPEVRDLLQLLLEAEGHAVQVAADSQTAIALIEEGLFLPHLILADYNLPGPRTGLEVARSLTTDVLGRLPVIILSGDVSAATLRQIEAFDCVYMSKPVRPAELMSAINELMGRRPKGADFAASANQIYVIDDDRRIRDGLAPILESEGYGVSTHGDAEAFLAAYDPERQGCILIDAGLPRMSGLDLLKTLRAGGHQIPAIVITGHSDVATAVEAMRAGATDFLEKPIRPAELIASIQRALATSLDSGARLSWQATAVRQLGDLTSRQRQIMHMVLAGHPNKNIAADLGISQRTVENHRAAIMVKTGAKSLPALARLALAAGGGQSDLS